LGLASTTLLIWGLRRRLDARPPPLGFGIVPPGLDRSESGPEPVDLSSVTEILERQRVEDRHDCAQCYVSQAGEVLLDVAVGETAPGRALRTDDLMLWYSSGKPLTTVAVLQLWERDRLELDDLVADYIDGWGAGKERCTLRHVLTHTGGFPMFRDTAYDTDISYQETIARIAAYPADWEPGTAAAYHPASGWKVLGAVVEAVDGRPIDQYLRDEIIDPLGMTDAYLGIPVDVQTQLRDRIVPVAWKGHRVPVIDGDGALSMVPYRIDEVHNQAWHVAKIEPGGGMRGPARALGRFYESLLGHGSVRVLEPRTVETMRAVHRYGLRDPILGDAPPFGLGVAVDFSGSPGRRAFGHGGMASSRGLADPDCDLVMVVICNGLPDPLTAERRNSEITDAIYTALGPRAARFRRSASAERTVALAT
jgi:CubicO group peptidase (beta-lactamase class C family)